MSVAHKSRPRGGPWFLGCAVGLIAVSGLCALTVRRYSEANTAIGHALEVRKQLFQWQIDLLDAETGARGYAATGHSEFLEPYRFAQGRERATAQVLSRLVADDPVLASKVANADADASPVLAELRDLVALVGSDHRDQALSRLGTGVNKQQMDQFRADLTQLLSVEEGVLKAQRARADSQGRLALASVFLLTLLAGSFVVLARQRESLYGLFFDVAARENRERVQSLSELADALSDARTRVQVAEVIVRHGMRAAKADTCTLYELDESGEVLRLVGHHGVAPEVLEKVRLLSAGDPNPGLFAAFKAGQATWAESVADYGKLYPSLLGVKSQAARAQAFWSIPLMAEGRPFGLLGVGFYQPRQFSNDEKSFIETVGGHCAQSLLRASRLEAEGRANRLLATTLQSIGDAVIATDAEGRVQFLNPVAERLTGYDQAEARGRSLEEVFCIFSEQTRQAVESPVTKVLREGTVVGLANHTVLKSRRGAEIPIDDSGAPIRNEEGTIIGVVLVFRDVTLEKRDRVRSDFLAKAGEALVSSIDYRGTLGTVARSAVPTLADWCAIELLEPGASRTKQVVVAHVDESKVELARQLGERYPADQDSPRGVPEVIRSGKSELYAEIPRELLEGSARDPEHLQMIRELQLRSAMVVPLRVRGRTFGAMTFVYAESGRRYDDDDLSFAEDFARRAAMAIENAMALKETEEARAREHRLRAAAEHANRAKDDFLATVSHELRTPLQSILGWSAMMRRRNPPPDLERPLAIIERNARLQTKLIDDVLDISRIISGKLVLRPGLLNAGEAILAAVEVVTPAAEAKQITIKVDIPAEEVVLTADADRLQQIIWNLLSNAVKFTPGGGWISVRARRQAAQVELVVTDSGEGIRPDMLVAVFEPFQQVDASTTRRHGGLGLGLAIVKQLVAAHGGTVCAESDGAGKGARFVVRLPVVASVAATRADPPLSTELPSASQLAVAVPRLDGLKVLVVDDEPDALNLIHEMLSEQGAEVHLASSAEAALEVFAKARPDVVVSDLGMPVIDGFSLIRSIRALSPQNGGRTPAIALTALTREHEIHRAFAAGYQRHIGKPVEMAQLATIIANLGGRSLEGA